MSRPPAVTDALQICFRVNPIYSEEASLPADRGQDSPRKSVSSGYESRGNSSSDSSPECTSKPKKRAKQERKKREKPNELIGNVLAANYSSIKRRPKKLSNGSPNGPSHLSPIPEGQIDLSIPPPIWPRCAGCQMPLQRVHSGITDPLNFIHRYNERFPATSNFRVQFLKEVAEDHPRHEYQHNWEECFRIQFEKHKQAVCGDGVGRQSGASSTTQGSPRQSRHPNELSQSILHDLANLLSQVMAQKNALSAEEVLLAVSQSLQRSLNSPTVKGEFLLYKDDVYSTSSSSGCKDIYVASSSSSSAGSLADRLKFFQRQKEEEVYHADVEKSSEGEMCDKRVHHQRDLSSSSIDSTSSFSPQSSSSGKVFLPDEIYSVPSSEINVITCDSKIGKSALSPGAQCGSSSYEKLISAKRKVSECAPKEASASKACGKAPTILKKVEHPYYVSSFLIYSLT